MEKRAVNTKTKEAPIIQPLDPKKRKKKKWPLGILVILIVVGIIYSFRIPLLNLFKEVPIIGQFMPDAFLKEEIPSIEELSIKVKAQEQEIEKLKAEKKTLEDNNAALSVQNESLKQYESMYADFLAQKEAWDEEVAKTNADLFIKQFESFYPDTAERIYSTLKGQQILSDKQKALSKTIGEMDETQAAKALELLIATDSELLQVIFEGMNIDRKALILSEMTSDSAAQIIKLIAPDNQLID